MIERIQENTSKDETKRKDSKIVNLVLLYNEKSFHSPQKEILGHERFSGKEITCDESVPKRRSMRKIVEGKKSDNRDKSQKSRDTYVEGEGNVTFSDESVRISGSDDRFKIFDHCIEREKEC